MLSECVVFKTAAAILRCDPRVTEPVRRRIAADPDRFVRAAAALPLKIGRETLVLQTVLSLDGEELAVAVKQYRPQSCWKALASIFRSSKAEQNWSKAAFLRSREIDVPRPLLTCRPRRWKDLGGSFLVSELVCGGENLHIFAWRIAKQPDAARHRIAAACADRLGRLIGRMHAAGAAHRDLKAANLLVLDGKAGPQVWLIDLDGLKLNQKIRPERQARDLARLAAGLAAHPWVSRATCRRFLRAYARAFPGGIIDWKALWRATAERTARIVARKRRRGKEVL